MDKLNLLVAYPYMKPDVIETIQRNQDDIRFVLDSGAFTAWKAGKPIQLDDYCRFLEGLPFKPWRYFTLDVIGDPEGSMRNYELLLKRGFNPVPIFTRGEDPSVLDDYYKTSDVVGIGGLVGTKQNKGFVNGIMRHVGNRKVHWLGFTSLNYIKHYKPYMCDSSTWESGARYGQFSLYLGSGKVRTVSKQDFANKPSRDICAALERIGVNPLELASTDAWHGGDSLNRNVAALNAVELSIDVRKHTGTQLFSAAATNLAVNLLLKASSRRKG